MDYIEKYFGKNPTSLTYEDIEDFFINVHEESDKIEFKSYATNGNEKEKPMLYVVCRLRTQYVLPGLCPGNKEPIAFETGTKMISVSSPRGLTLRTIARL